MLQAKLKPVHTTLSLNGAVMQEPSINKLLSIMAALRDPQQGCPWDRKQDFASIAPYTIEEAYEVVDAIDRNDMDELRDELGDLLFQVVFHAQMASEAGAFDFNDVVQAVVEKMTRRHPHVFADDTIHTPEQQTAAWELHKQREREEKESHRSRLDGVARSLPALWRAEKVQKRASKYGFDWPDVEGVMDKLLEEIDELRTEMDMAVHPEAIREEVGDLLFSCVNLTRHLQVNPEIALRQATDKFEQRFRGMEQKVVCNGKDLEEMELDELERYWEEQKQLAEQRRREQDGKPEKL